VRYWEVREAEARTWPDTKELTTTGVLRFYRRVMRAMERPRSAKALSLPMLVARSGMRARARVTHPGKR